MLTLRSPALILSAWSCCSASHPPASWPFSGPGTSCKSLRRSARTVSGPHGPRWWALVLTLSLLLSPERAQRWLEPLDLAIPHLHCPGHFLLVLLDGEILLQDGLQLLHLPSWSLALSSVTRTVCLRLPSSRILLAFESSRSSLDTERRKEEGGEPHEKDVLLGQAWQLRSLGPSNASSLSNSSPQG